jgi:hypothetical protein
MFEIDQLFDSVCIQMVSSVKDLCTNAFGKHDGKDPVKSSSRAVPI